MSQVSGESVVGRLVSQLAGPAKAVLTRAGWYDPRLPPSYAVGARPLSGVPVRPAPAIEVEDDLADLEDLNTFMANEAPSLFEAVGGRALTMQNVEEVLDELVRPALNADGGDITLLRIDDDNIFVKLVGSCSTCPSSVMTMRMGVERLLQEEFPQMNELIHVDAMFG